MPDFIAVTARPIDPALLASSSDISLRLLTTEEQIAIEDRLFADSALKVSLPDGATVLAIPEKYLKGTTLDEFAVAIEFVLAVLCKTGLQTIQISASFGATTCTGVTRIVTSEDFLPYYPKDLTGQAVCDWIAIFMGARQKVKDRMHVTADRFVRYSKSGITTDSLLDLCICLESLIGADNEIAFRFSMCLAKVSGGDIAIFEILNLLYSVRSNVVHGADSSKPFKKLEPNLPLLHDAARTILTKYIFHLASNSSDEWRKHLKTSLLV